MVIQGCLFYPTGRGTGRGMGGGIWIYCATLKRRTVPVVQNREVSPRTDRSLLVLVVHWRVFPARPDPLLGQLVVSVFARTGPANTDIRCVRCKTIHS